MSGPMDSRRNTYCPPARGNIAASSPYASAPRSVMTPVSTQATIRKNGDSTFRAMSAETMKIPEPIIEPATHIVASVSVMALTNSDCGCDGAASVGAVTLVITLRAWSVRLWLALGSQNTRTPADRAGVRSTEVYLLVGVTC